jgi:hypothetical protein
VPLDKKKFKLQIANCKLQISNEYNDSITNDALADASPLGGEEKGEGD